MRCQWDAVRSNASQRDAIVGMGGTTLFSNRQHRTRPWSHPMSQLPSRTPDSNHCRLTPFAIVAYAARLAAAVAMHFAKLKLRHQAPFCGVNGRQQAAAIRPRHAHSLFRVAAIYARKAWLAEHSSDCVYLVYVRKMYMCILARTSAQAKLVLGINQ